MSRMLRLIDAWQMEAFFVLVVLCGSAYGSGGRTTDWFGAAAVFVTFLHGQVSFDLQESQQRMSQPSVSCYRWSQRYFVGKEILWVVTFVLLQAWPLLAGTAIFATYPYWRRYLRARLAKLPPAAQ